jgi:hypothetical protein
LRARLKKNSIIVVFEPISIFLNLYTLGIFDLFWAQLQLEYAYLIGSVFKNLLHREKKDRNRCKEDAFGVGRVNININWTTEKASVGLFLHPRNSYAWLLKFRIIL